MSGASIRIRAGLLARTPRGRVATPAGWAHLGLAPPPGTVPLGAQPVLPLDEGSG